MISSHSAALVFTAGLQIWMAALLIRASSRRSLARTSLTILAGAVVSEKSALIRRRIFPADAGDLRSTPMTCQPFFWKTWAVDLPIPPPAPVNKCHGIHRSFFLSSSKRLWSVFSWTRFHAAGLLFAL